MRWNSLGGCSAMIAVFLMVAVWAQAGTARVQLREAPLKASPGVFAGTVEVLELGTEVTVLGSRRDWVQVQTTDKTGWVHEASLDQRTFKLAAGSRDTKAAASDNEVALAGKGFSAEVEAEYKARNPDVDFGPVDRIESMEFTPEELSAFMKKGGLLKGDES